MLRKIIKLIIFQCISFFPIIILGYFFYGKELAESIFAGEIVFFIIILFYYVSVTNYFGRIDSVSLINKTKLAVVSKFILTVALLIFLDRHFNLDLLVVVITFIIMYIENVFISSFLLFKRDYGGK